LSFIINGNLFQVGTLIKLLFKPKAILKTTNQLSEACRPLIWSSKRLFISPFILSSYLHHEDAIISLFYQLHGIWYKEILSTSSNSHCWFVYFFSCLPVCGFVCICFDCLPFVTHATTSQ
jgi:hypothetical protein